MIENVLTVVRKNNVLSVVSELYLPCWILTVILDMAVVNGSYK